MLAEDKKIREMPRVPGDGPNVEYAVLPLLLWSDETVLSNFGTAKLWPIYLYFGNLSKYVRGRPTEFAAHHLAYIPTVSHRSTSCFNDIGADDTISDPRRPQGSLQGSLRDPDQR